MTQLTDKLATARRFAALAGTPRKELAALIHGVGGSPRRANRITKADPDAAATLAAAFTADIAAGMHFSTAKVAAANRYETWEQSQSQESLLPEEAAPAGRPGVISQLVESLTARGLAA